MALFNAWYTAIIVLDANVLLNLYRFVPKKSRQLLDILEELSDRIRIPRQCYDEYRKHLPQVRREIGREYRESRGDFQSVRDNATNKLFQLNSRNGLVVAQYIQAIENLFREIITDLQIQSKEHMRSLFREDIDDRIARLIEGKIGDPFPQSRLDGIYLEGRFRYDNKIPPGFKDDKRKGEPECYGDLVAWKQIIEFANEDPMKRPIIMVTDDRSGHDWFYKHNGEPKGPRNELVQELRDQTGADFYLYTSEQFMWHADKYLRLRRHLVASGDSFRRFTPTLLPDFGKIAAIARMPALAASESILVGFENLNSLMAGIDSLYDSVDRIHDSLTGIRALSDTMDSFHKSLTGFSAFSDRFDHFHDSLATSNVLAGSVQQILDQVRTIDEMLKPSREFQRTVDEMLKPSREFQRTIDEMLKPSLSFQRSLHAVPKRISTDLIKNSITSISDLMPSTSYVLKNTIASMSDVAMDLTPSVNETIITHVRDEQPRTIDLLLKPTIDAQNYGTSTIMKQFLEEQQRTIDLLMKPYLGE